MELQLKHLYKIQKPRMTKAVRKNSNKSCPTLCDPIDGSPPGFPVPGILPARTLEWGAIAFSTYYSYLLCII